MKKRARGGWRPDAEYERLLWDHPLGQVFLHHEHPGGETTVVTVLDPTVRADGDLRRSYAETIIATAGIACAQVAPVLAIRAVSGGRIAFETRLGLGEPLATRLDRGHLSLATAVGVLRQVAHGLRIAHDADMLHGALSTSSVILSERDGRAAVQLTDFGVGSLTWNGHTRNPAIVPMSPERVMGLPRSAAEDAYLFGCVAYVVLCGEPPFDGASVQELRRRHAIEDAPQLAQRKRAAGLHPSLCAFTMRCLAKDPDDRFPSGAELEAALCEAQIAAGLATKCDHLELPHASSGRSIAIRRRLERLRGVTPRIVTPAARSPGPSRPPPPPPPGGGRQRSRPPPADAAPTGARRTKTAAEVAIAPPKAEVKPPAREAAPRVDHAPTHTAARTASRRSLWVLSGLSALGIAVAAAGWASLGGSDEKPAALDANVLDSPGFALKSQKASAVSSSADAQPSPSLEHAAEDVVIIEEEPEGRQERPTDRRASAPRKPTNASAPASRPSPGELVGRARQAEAQGRTREAEALLKQALREAPKHRAALEALSVSLFNRGNYRSAAKHLERAVRVAPRNAELRIRLGDSYFKLGQYAKARAQFARAVDLGHPSARRRMVRVDAKRG